MRVGFGYDIHKLTTGRKLILGGVEIPNLLGEEGYSDGDTLTHAIIDALLGAADLGDIGLHFPPGNKHYLNISSLTLLKKTMDLIAKAGYEIMNIDSTVIIEKPKLSPYIQSIKLKLAEVINTAAENISVKAKTKEGIGETGSGKAVEAYAVILLCRKNISRTE